MRNRLREHIGLLAYATQFLTRLPVPSLLPYEVDMLGRAAVYFPAVGILVGGLAAMVWVAAIGLGLPPLAAAALAVAATVFVTGGLHEDGLADCADGLGGGSSRERALEIMRDSRIGAYGALALALSLILRVACLAALPLWQGVFALIISLALGRTAIVLTLLLLPYARPEGLASGAAKTSGGLTGFAALGTGAGVALLLGHTAGAAAILAAAAAWKWFTWRLLRRLGGYTGDGLGATEQVVQIAALLAMVAVWA
ncbi:MAG: adenosylcobinamide-GDP ribazoletransferase [Pseudomonadota bacterium]